MSYNAVLEAGGWKVDPIINPKSGTASPGYKATLTGAGYIVDPIPKPMSLDEQFSAFMASLTGPRVLLDPSRASSRFQDAAASTLVTADGQPFARLNDSSGAGNHVSQSVGASMPLYRTDGALHWAQFDGSDDFWQSLANLDMSGTDKVTVVAGVKVAAAAGDQLRVVELGANAATTAGCFALESNIQSNAQFRGELFGSSRGVVDTPVTTFGVGKVVTAAYDTAPTSVLDEIKIRVNGAVANSPTLASAGTGNLGNFPLFIARRGAGGAFFNGLIYALLVIGRLLTTAERDLCERWMASKTGVTL